MAHEALTLCAPHRPLGTLAEDRTEQVRSLLYNLEQSTLRVKERDRQGVLQWGGRWAHGAEGAGAGAAQGWRRRWGKQRHRQKQAC